MDAGIVGRFTPQKNMDQTVLLSWAGFLRELYVLKMLRVIGIYLSQQFPGIDVHVIGDHTPRFGGFQDFFFIFRGIAVLRG